MNHQYLSFEKINNLACWWLENSKSRNVEIAALEPLIWKSGDYNIIDAVSYTHLDVYKRQLPFGCRVV